MQELAYLLRESEFEKSGQSSTQHFFQLHQLINQRNDAP